MSFHAKMPYDRRPLVAGHKGHLHYEGASEDAAWIAGEVIRKGRSTGWIEEDSERETATQIESLLAKFNIGYAGNGVWVHHPGGTRVF